MPSINRIRVNNVKYNFGTQYYDDFTMRMYGKNTLYDLANGGGKSVLMLLLMQNMIPNCTLDEKQPIEKLFRTGNGNTTIHSLIEWKLDPEDVDDGFRYMTTGFCARKAESGDTATEKGDREVASVEYFNYCIFYRDFNKNDIINLPLVKNGERVGFQSLRTYLKELPHKDLSLKVEIFDRKGAYQNFISAYGLHESQWEIIRGINKTEGHVRTYFEQNYKTTRKVVEDLLIEEIIEKAYNVKTEAEADGGASMAQMLLDIKEQLAELSKKKNDIANYDKQIELVAGLRAKVDSFLTLYQEQKKATKHLADLYVTAEQFSKGASTELEKLQAESEAKKKEATEMERRVASLKIASDRAHLKVLLAEAEKLSKECGEAGLAVKKRDLELSIKESGNDFLEYVSLRDEKNHLEGVIKHLMSDSTYDEDQMYAYVAKLKFYMDEMLATLRTEKKELEDKRQSALLEKEFRDKLLLTAQLSKASALQKKTDAEEEAENLSKRLADIRMTMNQVMFAASEDQLSGIAEELTTGADALVTAEKEYEDRQLALAEIRKNYRETELSVLALEKECEDLLTRAEEYAELRKNLDTLLSVYHADDAASLKEIITDRITETVLAVAADEKELKNRKKQLRRVKEGRLIRVSKACEEVLSYIETRHGSQAMHGMDYLSALPEDQRRELLRKNPELPYGIIVKDFEEIASDVMMNEMTNLDMPVAIYDMERLSEKALVAGENLIMARAGEEYLSEEESRKKAEEKLSVSITELTDSLAAKEEMLATYREDYAFAIRVTESDASRAEETLSEKRRTLAKTQEEKDRLIAEIKTEEHKQKELSEKIRGLRDRRQVLLEDKSKLATIEELRTVIAEKEEEAAKEAKEIKRLESELAGLNAKDSEDAVDLAELEASIRELEKKEEVRLREWDENYKAYYNPETDAEDLDIPEDEIKARIAAMLLDSQDNARAIEDKRQLAATLEASMDRIAKNIEKRGMAFKKIEAMYADGKITFADEQVIRAVEKSKAEAELFKTECERKLAAKRSEADRLDGSIAYAIAGVEKEYGSFEEITESNAEILDQLAKSEELMKRLREEAAEAEKNFAKFKRTESDMIDLYKDLKRITDSYDIDTAGASVLSEEKEALRNIFDEELLTFDRNRKAMDKAKHEMLKSKGTVTEALEKLSVFELAQTIRDDVVIPATYDDALSLTDNLKEMESYIALEKERIAKSLTDMETIKENFEEQCLQRCLDVRTELEKLPKLSRIVMDDETIQMVGLTIPYVKDEFLRQRMSDYIDHIVETADSYTQDKDRMKYIRTSLSLKKLFSVIVTDMNAIRLQLYKRERIKEQSRYLRYEEAVGSTGQSQGIYIQFLVAIINYISGMYKLTPEGTGTKTVFIDNPFGAAKDIYIWEPIFALLAANGVQLIVPARGATPAITGRFDVNYILGQQMSGGRQLTVVTDYTSTVDQQELEYRELDYEQVSFDFI